MLLMHRFVCSRVRVCRCCVATLEAGCRPSSPTNYFSNFTTTLLTHCKEGVDATYTQSVHAFFVLYAVYQLFLAVPAVLRGAGLAKERCPVDAL